MRWLLTILAIAVLPGFSSSALAQSPTLTTLHAFTRSDGSRPSTGLIQGSDGNFYGTTIAGGAANNGTVFKLTPAGTLSILHTFSAYDSHAVNDDGVEPYGLIQGSDGNFYGTTYVGGATGYGTVYQLTPDGVLTVLHSFVSTEGVGPLAGVIQGSDGNFYGTTSTGAHGGGAVYQLTPGGAFKVLYAFTQPGSNLTNVDGWNAQSALLQASDGNFYGTTHNGGTTGSGTLFRVTPAGEMTVLHTFETLPGGSGSANGEGANPKAGLIQGADGNLYGVTQGGGVNETGVLFRLTLAGTFTVLHSFDALDAQGRSTEGGVGAGLSTDQDGNLYGVNPDGGPSGGGTLFKFTPAGVLTVLHSFGSSTYDAGGSLPLGTLLLGSDGRFYGTAAGGGTSGWGTVFQLDLHRGSLAFAAGSVQVNAQAGSVNLTVTRTGGSAGTASVAYATVDADAVAGTDYAAAVGSLNWGDGDASARTITVPIIDRLLRDGLTRHFSVSLSQSTGGAASGSPAVTTVSIIDRPAPPAAPVISSVASANAQIGQAFRYQIVASNSPTGYAATGLPAGFGVDAVTGLISGVPSQSGTFVVGLSATNAGGTGSGTLGLTITAAPLPAPVVTSALSMTVQQGQNFSYQITASNSPTSFSADGLPPGLSIESVSGLISGTPTQAGAFRIKLGATNATGIGTDILVLNVASALPDVTLTATTSKVTLGSGEVGVFTMSIPVVQSSDVVVTYTVTGNALNGTDYLLLKGKAKIKAGKTSKSIKVVPQGDLGGMSKKTVVLMLALGDGYMVGTTGKVKVKIIGQ